MSFLCTSVFGIWNNTHIPGGLGNSQGATATSTASLNQIKLWQGFSASNLDRYRGAGGLSVWGRVPLNSSRLVGTVSVLLQIRLMWILRPPC